MFAVDVALGVKIRGSLMVPVPAQTPPVVAVVPIVILTCPDPNNGIGKAEFVIVAIGKTEFEKEVNAKPSDMKTKIKHFLIQLNFCNTATLRVFTKKSLLK